MDEIFRKTITNSYAYLVQNIQYDNLADYLLQYEVLPEAIVEDIDSLLTRKQKVRKLLDVLPRRSNKAFETFLQCLHVTNQSHIAELLVDKLQRNRTYLDGNGILPGPPFEKLPSITFQCEHLPIQETTSSTNTYTSNQPINHTSLNEVQGIGLRNRTYLDGNGCITSQCEHLPKQQLEKEINSLPKNETTSSTNTYTRTPPKCTEHVDPSYRDPEPQTAMEFELDSYDMDSSPRGYMIIINNDKFAGPLSDRSASSKDAHDIRDLFWNFGFLCDTRQNLTVEEMKQVLSDFSKLDAHKQVSCCAVVLMSHGDGHPEQHICGTGGEKVAVNKLIDYFDEQNCPNLRNKPKLFIIQACRNNKDSNSRDLNVSQPPDVTTQLSSDGIERKHYNLNSRSDMLIAHSTAHGNMSFRHKTTGSLFIQYIIEVFNRLARTTSVTDMLIEVNRKLREDYPLQGQIGVPEVALTKRWYLQPIK